MIWINYLLTNKAKHQVSAYKIHSVIDKQNKQTDKRETCSKPSVGKTPDIK